METEIHRQISKLIKKLKMNDGKRASDYEEEPKEPKGAMDALVKIGEPAVEPLLELLKDTSRYSCLYAIKVLGEIRDPTAVQPIIEALSSDGFAEAFEVAEVYDQPKLALQKNREKDDEIGMCNCLEILAGIKDEKSFMALVNMLSHPNSEVQDTAIMLLGDYGDQRAVEYLMKFLEDVDARDMAVEAIRKLLPSREYRDMIAPYAVERLESFRREIEECLRDLEYAHKYPSRFEGDDAEELNAIALEHKVGKSVQDLLRKSTELAVFEAVISDKMHKQLDKAFWKLWERQQKLKREHTEEIDIIEGYIPGTVLKEEKRSYKGLAPESMLAEHPRLDTLRTGIWEWLKKQEFRVFKKNSSLFARKGPKNARKGSYVAVVKDDEKPRTWGLIGLILWGDGWTKEDVEAFTEPFWRYVDKIVTELVGKKKFKVETQQMH